MHAKDIERDGEALLALAQECIELVRCLKNAGLGDVYWNIQTDRTPLNIGIQADSDEKARAIRKAIGLGAVTKAVYDGPGRRGRQTGQKGALHVHIYAIPVACTPIKKTIVVPPVPGGEREIVIGYDCEGFGPHDLSGRPLADAPETSVAVSKDLGV